MSDGLPSDEQLRRIARGVRGRIERRRAVVRGLAGTAAGVVLLAGAVAVLPRIATGTSSGSTAGGSAGRPAASAGASSSIEVRCRLDGLPRRTVTAPDDPSSIAAACGAVAVDFQSGSSRMPVESSSPSAASSPAASSPLAAVLCRADDGAIVVLSADGSPGSVCAARGLRPR